MVFRTTGPWFELDALSGSGITKYPIRLAYVAIQFMDHGDLKVSASTLQTATEARFAIGGMNLETIYTSPMMASTSANSV